MLVFILKLLLNRDWAKQFHGLFRTGNDLLSVRDGWKSTSFFEVNVIKFYIYWNSTALTLEPNNSMILMRYGKFLVMSKLKENLEKGIEML